MTGVGHSAGGLDEALRADVERFVACRAVLVASDYDGTLSELVDDPARAHKTAGQSIRSLPV